MGLMDKFKNLFTEEVEETEEPIKKEVMQVEIPSPIKKNTEEALEPKKVEEEKKDILEEAPVVKKEEYKFPFFDDEDFSAMEKISKPEPKKISSYRKEPKEVYNPVKEEKKVFKPTPIISPVYGILDKNYQKEDIKKKSDKPHAHYNPKEATVDEIRNKAYGTLEDDIETTLFGRNHVLFEEEKKEKEISDKEVRDELIETLDNTNDLTPDLLGERLRHGIEDADDEITDLLEEELNREEKEEKKVRTREKKSEPKKISDSELFDIIDSMYQKGDKK